MYIQAHLERSGVEHRQAGQILSTIRKWLKSSGPEWTTSRLKDLKTLYLKKLAGLPPSASWISLDAEGIPKGPFRRLWFIRRPRKAIDALMCYTGMCLKKDSKKQREKFFQSVKAIPVAVKHLPYLREACQEVKWPNWPSLGERDYLSTYPFTGQKKVPRVKGSGVNNLFEVSHELTYSIIRDLHDSHPGVFSVFFGDLYPHLFTSNYCLSDETFYPFIGRISCLQEKGCKARFIANPLLIIQCCSYPLGIYLFKVLRTLPFDCTYHQEDGVKWGQKKLSEGHTLFSVDLSDFTNNFPRDIIYRVLHMTPIPSEVCEFYSNLLDLPWDARSFIQDECLWEKGTPLGLYPSFPAFALAHGLLLRSIELRYGKRDTFRVLGDDVIISDPIVHKRYKQLLDQLGIPVSEPKCLSGNAGEFAGFIFTKDFRFRPQKVPSDDLNEWYVAHGLYYADDPYNWETPKDVLAFSLICLPKNENPRGLSLRARAHLAYLFGLTSLCQEDTRATGPWSDCTASILLRCFQEHWTPSTSLNKLRDQCVAFRDSFFLRNPDLAPLITPSSRLSWFKSLTAELPVYLRVLPSQFRVQEIARNAVKRSVDLLAYPPEQQELLTSYLEGLFLEVYA